MRVFKMVLFLILIVLLSGCPDLTGHGYMTKDYWYIEEYKNDMD